MKGEKEMKTIKTKEKLKKEKLLNIMRSVSFDGYNASKQEKDCFHFSKDGFLGLFWFIALKQVDSTDDKIYELITTQDKLPKYYIELIEVFEKRSGCTVIHKLTGE